MSPFFFAHPRARSSDRWKIARNDPVAGLLANHGADSHTIPSLKEPRAGESLPRRANGDALSAHFSRLIVSALGTQVLECVLALTWPVSSMPDRRGPQTGMCFLVA